MKNEFVTYEQAVKLKELGFNESCLFWFDEKNITFFKEFPMEQPSNFNITHLVSAPLKQQVFTWFREKYNLDCSIINWHNCLENWCFRIMNLVMSDNNNLDYDSYLIEENYDSYEDAELACIDKLISLIEALPPACY
jgi:hypothetical protein